MTSATTHAIDLPGGRLAVIIDGAAGGVPVVVLHGNSLSCSRHGGWWQPLRAPGRRVIAVDLPGHGASPWHGGWDDDLIPGYARTVAGLCAALALDRPVLIGHSLGGNIASECAAQGLALRGLALYGTPPIPRIPITVPPVLAPFFTASADRDALTALGTLLFAAPPPEWWYAEYHATDPRARIALGAALAAPTWHDQPAFLAKSPCPLLWIAGGRDPFMDARALAPIAGGFWGGGAQVVAEATHMDLGHAGVMELLNRFLAATIDHTSA